METGQIGGRGSKKGREPQENDPCFLCEKQILWGEVLEDALKQNGIPALTSSTVGAGMAMKAGNLFERIKFFVRYEHLEKAKELASDLFDSPDAEEKDKREGLLRQAFFNSRDYSPNWIEAKITPLVASHPSSPLRGVQVKVTITLLVTG